MQSRKLVFRLEGPQSTIADPEDKVFLPPRVPADPPDRAHRRLSPSIPGVRGRCWFLLIRPELLYAAISLKSMLVAAWIKTAQRKPTSSRATAIAAMFGCLLRPQTRREYF